MRDMKKIRVLDIHARKKETRLRQYLQVRMLKYLLKTRGKKRRPFKKETIIGNKIGNVEKLVS